MDLDALYSELTLKTNAKLALVVLDGLGDIATPEQGEVTPLEAKGVVIDRRAGRIETAACEELCDLLSKRIRKVGDAQVVIKAGKGHRFVVVFRGKGLEGPLTDADPHREGAPIPKVEPIAKK